MALLEDMYNAPWHCMGIVGGACFGPVDGVYQGSNVFAGRECTMHLALQKEKDTMHLALQGKLPPKKQQRLEARSN